MQDETRASVLNKSSALPWVWRHAGSKQMAPIFPFLGSKEGRRENWGIQFLLFT